MRRTISIVAIGAACALALTVGPAAASATGPAPRATECATVPYGWAGTATVDPGQSLATGMVVPSEPGVQLAVAAFDISTIDPAPGALAVRIGASPVADGASVDGGEIAVTNASSAAVVVTRVELSLDRCFQVESAAPAVGAAPASPEVVPEVPEGGLPETGQASMRVLGLAIVLTSAGAGLTLLGRRRLTAAVRAR
jgi:LPXTG-motif cell wall-anchored protein